MKRRSIAAGLVLVLSLSAFSGCQSLRRDSGVKESSKSDEDGEVTKVTGVQSEAPKGFFQNSRLSGAMSSEGRDVERSLGVR